MSAAALTPTSLRSALGDFRIEQLSTNSLGGDYLTYHQERGWALNHCSTTSTENEAVVVTKEDAVDTRISSTVSSGYFDRVYSAASYLNPWTWGTATVVTPATKSVEEVNDDLVTVRKGLIDEIAKSMDPNGAGYPIPRRKTFLPLLIQVDLLWAKVFSKRPEPTLRDLLLLKEAERKKLMDASLV